MVGHELYHNVKDVLALAPQSVTATIANAPIVDRAGFETVMWVIAVGAVSAADATNTYTFSAVHGDDPNLNDGVAVPAEDLLGAMPVINNTNQANRTYRVGYRGTKRYLRLVGTEANTFSALLGAVATLGRARHLPVA